MSLARVREIERERVVALSANAELHSAFTGIDPDRWQSSRTTLWRSRPPASVAGRVFDVEYLAHPRGAAAAVPGPAR
jgi:hypothetical protein